MVAPRPGALVRVLRRTASWRSGYAEDCKSLHPGSIPGEASICCRAGRFRRAPSGKLPQHRDRVPVFLDAAMVALARQGAAGQVAVVGEVSQLDGSPDRVGSGAADEVLVGLPASARHGVESSVDAFGKPLGSEAVE